MTRSRARSGVAMASTPAASASSRMASSAMKPPPIASDPTASDSITRPEQLPRSFPANLLRLEPERARQESLLEQGAGDDREPALHPQDGELQRNQREERQRPCREPCGIDMTFQCRSAEQPPCENPQCVVSGVRGGKQDQLATDSCNRELTRRSWRVGGTRINHPGLEPLRAQPLRDERPYDARPPRRPDLRSPPPAVRFPQRAAAPPDRRAPAAARRSESFRSGDPAPRASAGRRVVAPA